MINEGSSFKENPFFYVSQLCFAEMFFCKKQIVCLTRLSVLSVPIN